MKKVIHLIKKPILNHLKALTTIMIAGLLSSSSSTAAPVITSFSPASGAIGSSVTITGTGFSATPAQDIVFFGATRATVTAASITSLTVTVPIGATYQYITVTNLAVNLTAYSAQPFIVTLAGNIAFAEKQDFQTVALPEQVSIGDIDGDGKPDLAVTASDTISVLRNTSISGAVSFATKVDLPIVTGPLSVCFFDVDGDGKPDLATANYTSGTVSVFRNTSVPGTVSFAAKVDFACPGGPDLSDIGDIDGDGKPDLAVTNINGGTISVFRNTSIPGTISFAARVDFTASPSPEAVKIGDIDGDGKPDLVVAKYSPSNTIAVFRNTSTPGTVSFAAQVNFTTGAGPNSVCIGDIDGDGKSDLAVANRISNTISVFRNTSTPGTVSLAAKVDFTTGTAPYSVSIGDIDGDGKPDLAVANYNSNTASVFRNTSTSGTVSFVAKVDFTTGTNPYAVSIGDLDGDGKPDLAVPNVSSHWVSILQQIAPPTVTVSGGGTACANATLPNVSISLTGTAPWALTYAINGVNQTPVTGIASSPYIIAGATTGTYTVTSLSDAYMTGTTFNGSATVTITGPCMQWLNQNCTICTAGCYIDGGTIMPARGNQSTSVSTTPSNYGYVFWTFNASADSTYYFDLCSSTGTTMSLLRLHKSRTAGSNYCDPNSTDTTLVIQNTANGCTGTGAGLSKLIWTCQKSGTYYLESAGDNLTYWGLQNNQTATLSYKTLPSSSFVSSDVFYDKGIDGINGATSNYNNNEDWIYTYYCTDTISSAIGVQFVSFSTSPGDQLCVYDGNSINSPFIGCYSGPSITGTFSSTASDGALTFHFTSDDSGISTGWQANVSCVENLSVRNNAQTNKISIFPNPNDGDFTISFDKSRKGVSFKIFNYIGEEVYSERYDHSAIKEKHIMLKATAGIYLMVVNDGERQHVLKLVIQ